MDAKLQRLLQRRGWDLAASDYEKSWSRQLQPSTDKLLAFADVKPGESVIETASGTGLITLVVAEQARNGRVLATDISKKMLLQLEAAADAAGLTSIETAACSAEALATEEQFDVAVCALGLMYMPEPWQAIAELHRTLRPGGRVALSVWGERRNCGWASLFGIVDARVSSDVCPMFFALGAPTALTESMAEQGFVDIIEERIRVTLRFPTEAAALSAAFVGGPVALAYARFDGATKASAHAEYLDSIAQYRTGNGYLVPGEFVIAAGRKPGGRDQESSAHRSGQSADLKFKQHNRREN